MNMGSSSSTITNLVNEYHFTGNNNGITSGSQKIGTASASATTDVSPRTNLNYSTAINPSWWGKIVSVGTNASRKLIATVGNNSDLIQTFKHIGATALRVSMGDESLKNKAVKLVNTLLNNSTPQGSLTSKEQVQMDLVKRAADLQVEALEKVSDASDAFCTVALGSTGMRNNEVSTQPTIESISALRTRASAEERANEKQIIATVGPRLGIIPRGTEAPPSDYIISTFDNAPTKYGRLGQVKRDAEDITTQISGITFSILHSKAALLAESGILRPATWETSLFIGAIKQVSMPFTAQSYPNGHLFTSTSLISSTNLIHDAATSSTYNKIALSSYAYTLPFVDESRITRLALTGQIVITNQPYVPSEPIKLGFVYKKSDGRLYFNQATFINTDVITTSTNSELKNANITDVYADDRINVYDPTNKFTQREVTQYAQMVQENRLDDITLKRDRDSLQWEDVGSTSAKVVSSGLETLDENIDPNDDIELVDSDGNREPVVFRKTQTRNPQGLTFSFSSQWQVVVDLSKAVPVTPVEAFGDAVGSWTSIRPFSATLVAIYPQGVTLSVAVQTPSLNITVVQHPTSMRYIGNEYNGTIIELLGSVPDWYATQDPHDPWRIYYEVVKPLIDHSGRIAQIHSESGAAYALTVTHVTDCRVISGLPVLNRTQMKEHIILLITNIASWLSTSGPVTPYTSSSRQRLFMRIVEVVMFQTLSHIRVYTQQRDVLVRNYLRDCNAYNSVEALIDSSTLVARR